MAGWGWVNRENRVPYYQALFQLADKQHIRQWQTTPKSRYLLPPYYALLFGGLAGSMYMMCRMVMGKKTWYGK